MKVKVEKKVIVSMNFDEAEKLCKYLGKTSIGNVSELLSVTRSAAEPFNVVLGDLYNTLADGLGKP
jgi:hypothetical protein